MTKQETFDFVVGNLIKQGRPSVHSVQHVGMNGPSITCRYRSDAGLKCAAGWCIPDEQYDPSMEGQTVCESKWIQSMVAAHDLDLLVELQTAHDSYVTNTDSWLARFLDQARVIATDHNLNINVLNESAP